MRPLTSPSFRLRFTVAAHAALLLAVMLAGMPDFAHAGTISDGDFLSWSFDTTGTASVTREPAGGNPGARLNVNTISGPDVFATAIKSDYSTAIALNGEAFTLSLDVLSGPGSFLQGQGILLLVEQNSTIYGETLGVTFVHQNWDTLIFSGSFTPALFDKLLGPGPAIPDFSGGVDTKFGFSGANSRSGDLTQYYDNFQLQSPLLPSVPEPSSLCLLALASVVLFAHRCRALSKQ